MPREQRQQLRKAPIAEVKKGTLTSGVLRTQETPLVTPKKTSGQALAEAFNIAATAGAEIVGGYAKEQRRAEKAKEDAAQKLAGNNFGRLKAIEVEDWLYNEIKRISDAGEELDIVNLSKQSADKFMGYINAEGDKLSAAYTQAAFNTFTTRVDKVFNSITKTSEADRQKKFKFQATNGMLGAFETGDSAQDILAQLNASAWNGNPQEKLDAYTETAISFIKEEYAKKLDNPDYPFELDDYIKEYLEIKLPNNGPYLAKLPSTGDKIRKFKDDLTSDTNKTFTKNKNFWKDKVANAKTNPETTPTMFDNLINTGAELGYYNSEEQEKEIRDFRIKFDEDAIKKTIRELKEGERNVRAVLKGEGIYKYPTDTTVVEKLKQYKNYLDERVKEDTNFGQDEADKKYADIVDYVAEQQEFFTYTAAYKIDNPDNNTVFETLKPKTKKFVREAVKDKLALADAEYAASGDIKMYVEKLIPIAVNNKSAATGFIKAKFPNTTDINKVNEGVKLLNALSENGGWDVVNMLPAKQRHYYLALDAVKDVFPSTSANEMPLNEAEIARVEALVNDPTIQDYGEKISKIRANKEKIADSIDKLPDSLQNEMITIFDYVSQAVGDDNKAAKFMDNVIREQYYQKFDTSGWLDVFTEEGTPGNIELINGRNSPVKEYESKSTVLALTRQLTENVGYEPTELTNKDIRITWDDRSNSWKLTIYSSKGIGSLETFTIPVE